MPTARLLVALVLPVPLLAFIGCGSDITKPPAVTAYFATFHGEKELLARKNLAAKECEDRLRADYDEINARHDQTFGLTHHRGSICRRCGWRSWSRQPGG